MYEPALLASKTPKPFARRGGVPVNAGEKEYAMNNALFGGALQGSSRAVNRPISGYSHDFTDAFRTSPCVYRTITNLEQVSC